MRERFFIYECDRFLFKTENDYAISPDDVELVLSDYGYSTEDELTQIMTEEGLESCVDTGNYIPVYDKDYRGCIIPDGENIIPSLPMVDKINKVTEENFVNEGEMFEIHHSIVNDLYNSVDYYLRAIKLLKTVVVVFSGEGKWRVEYDENS